MDTIKFVLIVDDDLVTIFVSKNIISQMNVAEKIEVVEDGKEAIEFIEKHLPQEGWPDLILLDINMPGINGFEFLETYNQYFLNKGQKQNSVIVILSTSYANKDIEKAKMLGANDYIVKPLTENKMKEVLEKHFQISIST